jgi:hypothetical protein
MKEDSLTLTILNLTQQEAKKILESLRRIERKNPDKTYLCWVDGLRDKPPAGIIRIVKDIFPRKKGEKPEFLDLRARPQSL